MSLGFLDINPVSEDTSPVFPNENLPRFPQSTRFLP